MAEKIPEEKASNERKFGCPDLGASRSPTQSQKKILLVDDNETSQMMGMLILGKAGYQVETANGGSEALQLLETKLYDLILMDLQMPEIDGLSVTRSIRAGCSRNSDTPVLAFSANVTNNIIEQCKAAGMNGFISKPFNTKQMLEVVEQWAGTTSSSTSG